MIRILKYGWLLVVVGGGAALALLALAGDDPGGAALLGGIALVALLVAFLFPDPRPRKPRGFEPHRRR